VFSLLHGVRTILGGGGRFDLLCDGYQCQSGRVVKLTTRLSSGPQLCKLYRNSQWQRTVAVRHEQGSPAGIEEWMSVCVGRGLATGRSPVQGALLRVYRDITPCPNSMSVASVTGRGILNISQPYRPPRSVKGIALLYGDGVCFL
jgi:hypothetical protein